MRFTVLSCLASLAVISGAAACAQIDPIPPHGTIRFQLDAPLCGTKLPVRFWLDGNVTDFDTLIVGLANAHTSHDIGVSPGLHTVRAELFAPSLNDWRRVNGWDDKSLTVEAGQTVTDTLPFYCS